MGISHLQNKYTRFNTNTSEEFNTASRSIKPGLIASGIVSAWTWYAFRRLSPSGAVPGMSMLTDVQGGYIATKLYRSISIWCRRTFLVSLISAVDLRRY